MMTDHVFKKKATVFCIAWLACTLYSTVSLCQHSGFRFENINSEQGLTDLNISAIIQDVQGFIWIGSEDGLTRYDGYTCVVYRHQDNKPGSISDNEIYALCTDEEGSLWVGTRNGLNRYDAQNDAFENFYHDNSDDHSLSSNEIFALAKDPEGNLWIGTLGGGLDMMIKTKNSSGTKNFRYRFIHHRYDENDSNSISSNNVFSICFDNNRRAWIGTSYGLNVLHLPGKKFARFYHVPGDDNSISNDIANRIFKGKDGTIWICGKGMLDNISWDGIAGQNKISIHHLLPEITDDENLTDWAINDFITDGHGNAWMATNDQGLFKFKITGAGKINSREHFVSNGQSSFSLAHTIVIKLYEDRSGVIWIGTAKGMSKFVPSKNRFTEVKLSEDISLPYKHAVMALLFDINKRLWIGFDSDTLGITGKEGSSTIVLQPKSGTLQDKGFDQVNTLYQSPAGDIYIGTFLQGLYIIPHTLKNIYDKSKWIHINTKQYPGLPSNKIYAVTGDNSGTIWIGTYKGLCMYDPGTGQIHSVYVSPQGIIASRFIIRTLCTDEKNNIWCGTDEGLYLIKDGKIIKTFLNDMRDSASVSNNRITVVFIDHNKNTWIGTKQGLNLYNAGRNNFQRFTTAQNTLVSDGIRSILEDGNDNLWIGTNQGILKFSINERKSIAFSTEDGLCSDQFELNAACSDPNGIFYFGANNGLVSFRPDSITRNVFVPPVIVTNIRISNRPLSLINDTTLINTYRKEKRLLLKYNQNFFSFEFAALSYINSSANQYAYMLEGLDPDWNYAGTKRFADYTAIKPGSYTFKVKASNNDGLWNEVPATVEVIILPPWWQTWWFYTLCAIAVCSIVYTIYRIRLKQILRLYKLRSSIAKDLHDDVGSALSSIAMLSNIAQSGKTNAKLQPEEIFSRIGDTSKRMIDLMDDIVWSVNPDNDRFSNMLVRMREYAVEMLEAKNIPFTFKISANIDELKLPMQMRKDYFLIFKEAVNNLAKYSGAANACIIIERNKNNIITTILDNGKGFDPQIIHSGNGLKNMQERAAALKGNLTIQTNSTGTSVILIVAVT